MHPESSAPQPVVFALKTLVRITRPGCATVTLRIPDHVDWFDLVQRCAKEFGSPPRPEAKTDPKYK